MKKFLSGLVIIATMLIGSVDAYQTANDGSLQVTFKNGLNVVYDNTYKTLETFK